MSNLKTMDSSSTLFIFPVLCLAVVFIRKILFRSQSGLPLPPGPSGGWLWEPTVPLDGVSFKYAEWISQYGPVISFKQGGKLVVIIGSQRAAHEIMEKQGGLLVDRPRNIAAGELLSKNLRLITASGGDQFKRLRRAAHTHLQPKAAESYEPFQMDHAKDVILDILDDPKAHIGHARRYAASVVLRVTYGKTVPTNHSDREMIEINKILKRVQKSFITESFLVNRFPFLRYIPWYTARFEQWHREELALFSAQLARVKSDMEKNDAAPSFARYMLEHTDSPLSHDEMAYLAGALFAAGSDTTAAAISIIIMTAACYPQAQAHVQEELDLVVGRERAPTFDDWDALPRLHAFTLEVLRWRPISPLGFAHRASEDIIWNNYCIPAGSTVLGHHWSISRDCDVFPNPEKFDPGRWMTTDGKINPDLKFPTYGFGRRVCPGLHVANRSIFINTALLFWSFQISQRPETPIDNMALGNSIIAHPSPFEVNFHARMDENELRAAMNSYTST